VKGPDRCHRGRRADERTHARSRSRRRSAAQRVPFAAAVAPFHTDTDPEDPVYHDNDDCPYGQAIKQNANDKSGRTVADGVSGAPNMRLREGREASHMKLHKRVIEDLMVVPGEPADLKAEHEGDQERLAARPKTNRARKTWPRRTSRISKRSCPRPQELLYATDTYAVLVILQALDAAGKDGTIKHVMSGVNPQGCEVTAFKRPSADELSHDFLWRCEKRSRREDGSGSSTAPTTKRCS